MSCLRNDSSCHLAEILLPLLPPLVTDQFGFLVGLLESVVQEDMGVRCRSATHGHIGVRRAPQGRANQPRYPQTYLAASRVRWVNPVELMVEAAAIRDEI